MVKQLKEKAISMFEALHPNCQRNTGPKIDVFSFCLSSSAALFVFTKAAIIKHLIQRFSR